MTRRPPRPSRRRWAAALLTAAVVAAGAAGPAATAPAPVPGAPAEHHSDFLRLSVDRVTPSVVEADGPEKVTVSGTITNIGDRDVSEVSIRLQRADPVTEDEQLRSALTWSEERYGVFGEFVAVTDELAEGDSTSFTAELPLDSAVGPSLQIREPGVYPLLVNVNATPDFGGPARLDDARFLLPVLDPPIAADAADRPEPPDPSPPVPTTMLVPLSAAPQRAAGAPGTGTDDTAIRLVDDDLAAELGDGGRLRGLVDATAAVTDTDPGAAAGLCLAIDPDLLVTVDQMRSGYLISEDPADPDAKARPGTGTEAAEEWLTDLRALADRMCTVAVPYAQADLGAVTDLHMELLSEITVATPTEIVDALLQTESRPELLWPSTGQISPSVAQALPADDPRTLLLSSNAVADAGPTGSRLAGLEQRFGVATFAMPAAAALAAIGTDPIIPSFVPTEMRYDLDFDSATARLQDALSAMAWYAMGPGPGGQDDGERDRGRPPRPVLLAPPQLWTVDGRTAQTVLETYVGLARRGLTAPLPLERYLAPAADPAAPAVGLVDPVLGDGVGEFGPPVDDTDDDSSVDSAIADRTQAVPGSLVTLAQELIPAQRSLAASLTDTPNAPLTTTEYLTPLRRDLLRMLSTAGRGGAETARAQDAAEDRGRALRRSVDEQFAAVTVLEPGATYTLASAQSPLLIVARNDLPISVRAQLKIQAPTEVEITGDGNEYVLPPRGTRQIQVPADIEFSRELDVRVQLTTLDGTPLGEQVHISVNSNAYGNIIPIATIVFGGLLLVLAGRRAWHRIKGRPDPADERRPVISPPDRFVHAPPPSVVVRHPATAPPRTVPVHKPPQPPQVRPSDGPADHRPPGDRPPDHDPPPYES